MSYSQLQTINPSSNGGFKWLVVFVLFNIVAGIPHLKNAGYYKAEIKDVAKGKNSASVQENYVGITFSNAEEKTANGQPEKNLSMEALRFTENLGQVADLDGKPRPDILFTAQNKGVKLFLTPNAIHYQFAKVVESKTPGEDNLNEPDETNTELYRLDLKLVNANVNPIVVREGEGKDVENFFQEHCPEGIMGVKNYNRITYKEVYPNIDWVVYTKGNILEYDFVVRPGGKIADIQLQYDGADKVELNAAGELHIQTPLGKITEHKPFSFQQGDKEVASHFVLNDHSVGFDVPAYNEHESLTIDPGVEWATYYGGSDGEGGIVTIDKEGNIYLCGSTTSSTSISFNGHQNTKGSVTDAYLVKFNPQGVRQWATYYGGTGNEGGSSATTDLDGNIYLAGTTSATSSISFGGHQNILGGGSDAFLVKFNSIGVRLWATYYGGTMTDQGNSVSCDALGNIYLAGTTNSSTGIASGGHQNTLGGGTDAFLVKFNSIGVRLWATHYGGTMNDQGYSVSTDPTGNVYLAGNTLSTSSIAFNGHQNNITSGESGSSIDGFLVKFTSSGVRQWATYIGSSEFIDQARSVATDSHGNVFLTGIFSRNGAGFNGHQNEFGGGGTDAFLTKFNSSGVMQWLTYYGGSRLEGGLSVCVDPENNIYMAGATNSSNNIAFNGFQNERGEYNDAFLVKFTNDGQRIWGTYYGGNGIDEGHSIATNSSDYIYLAGYTGSLSDISSNGHQNTIGGGNDAFLVMFNEIVPLTLTSFSPGSGSVGTDVIIGGTGFVDVTDVQFNGISSLHFTVDNTSQITATVPAGATTGKISVVTGEGSANSADDFIVLPPASITSFSPMEGNPGTTVTINGISLGGPVSVKFNGVDATNVSEISSTEITAVVPVNATTGKIEVVATLGTALSADDFVVLPTWYRDQDEDGFGTINDTQGSLLQPPGYVAVAGDCNDNDDAINPLAVEVCDGVDNDCDVYIDELCSGSLLGWSKAAIVEYAENFVPFEFNGVGVDKDGKVRVFGLSRDGVLFARHDKEGELKTFNK